MREHTSQLTVDEAMAEFQMVLTEELGDGFVSGPTAPRTPREAEEDRFRLAEYMLSLACPDARACTDQQCRRRLCRHLERVHAKRASGRSSHPRRTPGIEAVRYAVWVYMNSGR